tara:strand:- start:1262 stop:2617 length:1356 start_codon:yes stop_codon:yes gene_type:complete
MALNFSEGLLSGLRHYGQRQQPRQQRGPGGGMLTPAQQPSGIGELVAQKFGKVAGVDMRTPLERLQEDLATIDITDENAVLNASQVLMRSGSPEAQIQALELAQKFKAAQAAKALENEKKLRRAALRDSLVKRATELNLDGIAATVVSVDDEAHLREIATQIRDFEKINILATKGKAGRRVLAKAAGLEAEFENGDFEGSSDDEFKAIIEGHKGETKPYVNEEGQAVVLRESAFGRVWNKEKEQFVNPSDMGLTPAPQVTKMLTQADKMTDALIGARVESFGELHESANTAVQTININTRSFDILDRGVYSGTLGKVLTGTEKLAYAFGLKDADTASNTEEYVATRAREVGNFIQNFGAGTGLSDADRAYAEKAVAGDISLTEPALRRLLEISNIVSMDILSQHRAVVDKMAEVGDEETARALALFALPPLRPYVPPPPGLSAQAQQYLIK